MDIMYAFLWLLKAAVNTKRPKGFVSTKEILRNACCYLLELELAGTERWVGADCLMILYVWFLH